MSSHSVNEYAIQRVKISSGDPVASVGFCRIPGGFSIVIDDTIFRVRERGEIGLSVEREDGSK